jgi:3-dehydroquinate dehydratase type I
MMKPRVCAVITNNNERAIRAVEPWVELFEVRIDLIGDGWPDLARQLKKPWIACARSSSEGGNWDEARANKIEVLTRASELGATMVDLELATASLEQAILLIKKRSRCLLSVHDLERTPPLNQLKKVVHRQLKSGADVCKVITTAQNLADNLTTLELIREFPETSIISFAMGPLGMTSRIFCPLVGGYLTYAAIEEGKESAPGQITVTQLRKIYGMVKG